jgi:hypothetical protein
MQSQWAVKSTTRLARMEPPGPDGAKPPSGLEPVTQPAAWGKWPRLWLSVLLACLWAAGPGADFHSLWAQHASYERAPIDYLDAEVNDPVAVLNRQLAAGEVDLPYDPQHGYLPAILSALDIPVSSQTLVFSKTSLQLQRISPRLPRALYFNDQVYVGWCQRGDVLEFGSTDDQQGAIFYTLEQTPAQVPQFIRDRGSCLTCHATSRTHNVPGYLIRSVYPNSAGHAILGSGTFVTDPTSPFHQRWGGWYVTGQHGRMRHMGNQVFHKDDTAAADLEPGANVQCLEPWIKTSSYLSPHSDLVALMVLEHQTQMHNALIAANFETRAALHQSYEMNALLDRPSDFISDSSGRRIDAVAEQVLRHLLFVDEFELQDPVSGTSGFAADFMSRGPWDDAGRSLRDLDLQRRMFRYPCSYLIYSGSFQELPIKVKHRIVTRLQEILGPDQPPPPFQHLSSDDRRSIREILAQTHPDFSTTFATPAPDDTDQVDNADPP